ncbi:hypothetical protein CAOG_03069 [Capsaspora owczarzaki ATCC 30864]|uniref:Activator of Hsp90 ATPase AHSA1-like N-terminal domain-containing protein n=1 Tax=Capsaspora owczarzaki (strain ATCC 30864) TaxID=595528 RepID=A0A0D2UAH3_CAPO3|nr:hypothetical protein CAOG_03069 [Capsaspora owczarzaki ATCC 30864]KJE92036.1 hypothetical protein CAOG_003069 [Capsaspora owczarzaki ATCC 30864]|eukprot:XP_004363908.1 hypothetical protein CAOG_03069 [Capsaspora owczarzaki ATCC 30864]
MAKAGEGDPRWIVEDRPDATNVNNWHWSERDATGWSKDKLQALIKDASLQVDGTTFRLTETAKLEGEASANNRKAKLIFFYEWELRIKFVTELGEAMLAKQPAGAPLIEGEIEVLNFSEENDPDDIDINVSLKAGSEANPLASGLRQTLRKKGVAFIGGIVARYVKDLREEYAKGLILPTLKPAAAAATAAAAASSASKPIAKSSTAAEGESAAAAAAASTSRAGAAGVASTNIPTVTITQRHEFKTSAHELYDCLVNVARIQAFTQSPCQVDARPNGIFSIYNGNVLGSFISLVPGVKIEQDWRFSHWPQGHFSRVTIELREDSDFTELKLTQTGVPKEEQAQTDAGWNTHFWQKIMGVFGYGAAFF